MLGMSPSAVDKCLERAVQLLGTSSRFAAAFALAADEGVSAYERLPSDAIDVQDGPPFLPGSWAHRRAMMARAG